MAKPRAHGQHTNIEIKVPENGNITIPKRSRNGWTLKPKLPDDLQWISANFTWTKLKPAIRSSCAGWISVILFLIPRVETYMSQASFFLLISSFLSPPSDPFLAVFEREVLIILFVSLAWAWGSLGIRLADLVRIKHDPNVSLAMALSGQYVEAAPNVIIALFMFLGTIFLSYVRAKQGPGPYNPACVFGCMCLDISLMTAVLFPYPLYSTGKAVIISLGFHSSIAVVCSLLIFPSTISAQFTTRLQAVLTPLITSLELHRKLLKTSTSSNEFLELSQTIMFTVKEAEGELTPLTISGRLLESDLIYCRFAPTDFRSIQRIIMQMAVRANGMTIYFTLIDPTRERFPATPVPSRPVSPVGTPTRSRAPSLAPSLRRAQSEDSVNDGNTVSTPTLSHPYRRSLPHHFHGSHHHHHRHLVHNSLLHIPLPHIPKSEHAVGVFESQRYLNLETTHFSEPNAAEILQQTVCLLSECCDPLIGECREAMEWLRTWLNGVRSGRWKFWVGTTEVKKAWRKNLEDAQQLRDKLSSSLETFKMEGRHLVLDPYRPAFEGRCKDIPPHRYLFHSFVYQYHLMHFVSMVLEMLDEIIRLEKERQGNRLWTPVRRLFQLASWGLADYNDEDDEDPDTIQGLDPAFLEDLCMPQRRDPDALPPTNAFEWLMSHLYLGVASLGGGNALYAVKAGVLTLLLCIPGFLSSTARLAYENRFVWAIIMAQLILARFRGDTAFGLVARIFSTFMGGVVGMVMWYIGQGNPYGLAAVCGVCFPFLFYTRLYWPAPHPMRVIVFFVTAVLVLGYSYQDLHISLFGSPGVGFDVAWRRRFVLVTAGIVAAFIFSFFPPSRTIRRYHRTTLSTSCTELGALYCAILSFAHSHTERENQEITTSLIAIRSKLNRSVGLKDNATYEFSLRGRWPAQRYGKILELQLHIAYSLSHLFSVIEHLEPQWTRAFLRRTRLSDPNFQGDVLAVITLLATALRTGTPLPQITPCPLLDRYMLKYHGLNVVHKDDEDDLELPRLLTLETLENEQYLIFSVALATTSGIINRLDRLMIAVKEIVGEQYHIHGIHAGDLTASCSKVG